MDGNMPKDLHLPWQPPQQQEPAAERAVPTLNWAEEMAVIALPSDSEDESRHPPTPRRDRPPTSSGSKPAGRSQSSRPSQSTPTGRVKQSTSRTVTPSSTGERSSNGNAVAPQRNRPTSSAPAAENRPPRSENKKTRAPRAPASSSEARKSKTPATATSAPRTDHSSARRPKGPPPPIGMDQLPPSFRAQFEEMATLLKSLQATQTAASQAPPAPPVPKKGAEEAEDLLEVELHPQDDLTKDSVGVPQLNAAMCKTALFNRDHAEYHSLFRRLRDRWTTVLKTSRGLLAEYLTSLAALEEKLERKVPAPWFHTDHMDNIAACSSASKMLHVHVYALRKAQADLITEQGWRTLFQVDSSTAVRMVEALSHLPLLFQHKYTMHLPHPLAMCAERNLYSLENDMDSLRLQHLMEATEYVGKHSLLHAQQVIPLRNSHIRSELLETPRDGFDSNRHWESLLTSDLRDQKQVKKRKAEDGSRETDRKRASPEVPSDSDGVAKSKNSNKPRDQKNQDAQKRGKNHSRRRQRQNRKDKRSKKH